MVDNLDKRGLVHRLIEAIFPGQVAVIVEEFSVLSADEQDEPGRLCKKLGLRERAPQG